jgi:hypothetical protein
MITATEATAEVFWIAFRALPQQERDAVIEKLLEEQEFLEDIIDLAIIERRKPEPSRSLDEYLAERSSSG